MPYSIKILRGLEELDPKVRGVILDLLEEIEKNTRETVKKSDFDELKEAITGLTRTVNELAEAQKRSEERITKLEIAVESLIEAQKRSEERIERLEIAVEKLAEAQKRSEERLNELAEAQKRTEESLNRLIKRVDAIEERLDGISNSVGYSLENSAYKGLPLLLKREGIDVKGRLIRRYYEEYQINIWGEGKKDGKDTLILGEVKVRPSKKEIDRFLRTVNTIIKNEKKDAYTVFVAHDYHPATEKYLSEKGIKHYWSYELE
ncbi:MAG: hypothetical protein N2745_09395 [Syntrophorhabdaceae bacterium]|nr:hypothetical protein [Syntrophorhabdaceae bacterium]